MKKNNFRGDRMRERRVSLGMTQTELSVKTGIPQSAISAYEDGKFPGERLVLIADTLGISLDFLMNRSDEPNGEFLTVEQVSSRDAQLLLDAWKNEAFLDVIRMALEEAAKRQRVTPFNGAK